MAKIPGTLEEEINHSPRNDRDKPAVKAALKMMGKTKTIKSNVEKDLLAIQNLFEETFEVIDPKINRRVPGFMIQQAMELLTRKTKFPSFSCRSDGRDPVIQKIVTDAVTRAMDISGFNKILTDKFGIYGRMYLFGDAIIRVGTDTENEFPVMFQPGSLTKTYFDVYATEMRNPGGEHEADEVSVIYNYSWDEAIKLYPELKKNGGIGKIPAGEASTLKNEIWTDQQNQRKEREVEICHYYNKRQKVYSIFAGSSCTLLSELKGDDYPFMMDDKPYIPIIHFHCFSSVQGFYNWGIGHLLYRLTIIERILMNKGVNQAFNNANPLRLLRLPKDKKSTMLNRIREALTMQKQDLPGIVIDEVGTTDITTPARMEAFSTEQLTGEWERLFAKLDQVLRRLGINLDALSISAQKPLGVVEIEEENQNEFIKYRHVKNSSEYEFTIKLVMDFIKKFVTKDSKWFDQPVILKEKVKVNIKTPEGEEVVEQEFTDITWGDIAEELEKHNYYVEINTAAGSSNSRLLEKVRLRRIAPSLAGLKAQKKVLKELIQLDGIPLDDDDLEPIGAPELGAAPAEGAPTEIEGGAVPEELPL